MSHKYPVLIGDIGGTNVRLNLMKLSKDMNEPPEIIEKIKVSPLNYPSLEKVFENTLSKYKGTENYPLYAVVGIPGPIKNNEILSITNIFHWKNEKGDEIAKQTNMKKVIFLNDFTCCGYGIQTNLKLNEDYIILNKGEVTEGGGKTVIGPGTGIGMGYLVKDPDNEYYTIGGSEGGHQDFCPKNELYKELREFTMKLLGQTNLSIERICCGQGLVPIYKFLREKFKDVKRDEELGKKIDEFNDMKDGDTTNKLNIELVKKGLDNSCPLCKKVLELFIEIFGEVCGDAALFSLPSNGLYLTGGLSVALEPLITGTSIFMDHFLNKDNFEYLLKTFPVYLVRNGDLGVLGAQECARRLVVKNEK